MNIEYDYEMYFPHTGHSISRRYINFTCYSSCQTQLYRSKGREKNQFRDKNTIRNLTLASFQFPCLIMCPTMSDRWKFQENQP